MTTYYQDSVSFIKRDFNIINKKEKKLEMKKWHENH